MDSVLAIAFLAAASNLARQHPGHLSHPPPHPSFLCRARTGQGEDGLLFLWEMLKYCYLYVLYPAAVTTAAAAAAELESAAPIQAGPVGAAQGMCLSLIHI